MTTRKILNNLIKLLKSYQWNILWLNIKDIDTNKLDDITAKQILSLRAFLLSALFGDNASAEKILVKFPDKIDDPIIYFTVTLSWLSIINQEKIDIYVRYVPPKLLNWMRYWIQIEYLGRSFKYEEQSKLVEKLAVNDKNIDDYIKTALYNTLFDKTRYLKHTKKLIISLNLINNKDPLSILLCIATELKDVKDIKFSEHFFLKNIYTTHLLLNKHYLYECMILYDELASNNMLTLNSAITWLSYFISFPENGINIFNKIEELFKFLPATLYIRGSVVTYALIYSWITNNINQINNIIKHFKEYDKLPVDDFIKNNKIFFRYVLRLSISRNENTNLYKNNKISKPLYVLGESHSLSLSNLNFSFEDKLYTGSTCFIMGVKMQHLSKFDISNNSICFKEHIKIIPDFSDILITIGEIDCRPNEGIWKYFLAHDITIEEIIENTVSNYMEFLLDCLREKFFYSITIQGIMAPGYVLIDSNDPQDEIGFLNMIKKVNERLKYFSLENKWNFLDVYSATVGNNGKSNMQWHIDDYHLKPSFYTESNKWLIKPEAKKRRQYL